MSIAELLTPPPPRREDFATAKAYTLAWLDWRRTGIGGSDAPKVAGVAPRSYGSRLKVQWDKLGLSTPEKPSIEMRRGNALEPLIGELVQERLEEEFAGSQVLCRHPDYPFMISSIDWTRKNGRIVEGKSIKDVVARYYKLGPDGDTASVMMFWQVQCQHNMAVYGTDLCTLAVFVDDELRCYDIERDEEVIENLIEIEADFWENHVLRQLPCHDYAPSDADMISRRYRGETGEHLTLDRHDLLTAALAYESLGETISELNKQVKDAENEKKVEKARILDALGDAASATLPMGYTVSRKIKPRSGYTVKPSSSVTIDIDSPLFSKRSIA